MLSKLRKLALDMIPVILGVLIGLLINGWKEKMDDKRYLQKAFNAIEQEVISSKADLEVVIASHGALLDTLGFYLENESITLADIFLKVGGLDAPVIKNLAFSFFVNDRGDLIDYQLISIMVELEESKKNLDQKLTRLADFTGDKLYGTDRGTKTKALLFLNDILESEMELVEVYNRYLAQMDE